MKHLLAGAVFVLMLGIGPPLWAAVEDCDLLLAEAEQVRQMREQDSAAGVAEATRWLNALSSERQEACPDAVSQMLRARASNLTVQGDMRAALEDIAAGMAVLEASGRDFPLQLAALHLSAGVAHWELEQHDQAIGHYLQAMQINEQHGDVDGAARAAGNLGNLYNTLGDFDQARAYHRRALEGFEQADNQIGQAGTLINLAALDFRQSSIARRDGELDLAREFDQSALELGLRSLTLFEALGNPLGIAYASNNVASALDSLGEHEASLPYYQRSLDIRLDVGERLGAVRSMLTKAGALIALERFDEAEALLDDALPITPEDNLSLMADWLERGVDLAAARQQYAEALNLHRRLLAKRMAISENQMSLRVEEMRLGFETERQDQQLELLRSEALIRDLQLDRQRVTSVSAIAVALALLVLLVLLWRMYRQGHRMGVALAVAARTDTLTGLANRREMDRRIADFLGSDSSRHERQAALILIDADNFKQINDCLGHLQGDEVLKRLAEVLEHALGHAGRIARWGGEEFLVIAPDHDETAARELAERLRLAVIQAEILAGDQPVSITLGVTLLSSREKAVDPALARADRALYQGKSEGKNRVVLEPLVGSV